MDTKQFQNPIVNSIYMSVVDYELVLEGGKKEFRRLGDFWGERFQAELETTVICLFKLSSFFFSNLPFYHQTYSNSEAVITFIPRQIFS